MGKLSIRISFGEWPDFTLRYLEILTSREERLISRKGVPLAFDPIFSETGAGRPM